MTKHQVVVQHGILLKQNLDRVDVDSEEWFEWLKENSTFRFEHDGQSFSARKENPLKRSASDNAGGDGLPEYDDSKAYWQAYRKVDGKTRKRYIGKSATLTHDRLIEISKALDEPAAPKPEKEQSIRLSDTEATQLESKTYRLQTNYDNAIERIKELEAEVTKLHNQIRDYEAKPEAQEPELHKPIRDLEPAAPALDLPDLEEIRDQIISKWRVAPRAESRDRIKQALNKFIEAIHKASPSITDTE